MKNPPRQNPWNTNGNSQGFALIFVLVFIALLTSFLVSLVLQIQLQGQKALDDSAAAKAGATAMTGLEFAKILLELDSLASTYQAQASSLPFPGKLYTLLNNQPFGKGGLEALVSLMGDKSTEILDPDVIQTMENIDGYFILNVSSESDKFNLNLLRGPYFSTAVEGLRRMFSSPEAEALLDLYQLTPEELLSQLVVYIKGSASLPGASTARGYDLLEVSYEPKDGPLASLEELHRIPGFHIDEIYETFVPYFTVWPADGGTINLNSAPSELVATLLTPPGMPLDNQQWDALDYSRKDKKFNSNTISNLLTGNNLISSQDSIAQAMRRNLFGAEDKVFRIEIKSYVEPIQTKLVVIVEKKANGSFEEIWRSSLQEAD